MHNELPQAFRHGLARVLVVDACKESADATAEMLRVLGNHVDIAYTAEQAMKLAQASPPTLVLTELSLPGLELARALRAEPATSGAVLVAVTGNADARRRAEAERAGFDHVLRKPDLLHSAILVKQENSSTDS